jgi:hypothetical protein
VRRLRSEVVAVIAIIVGMSHIGAILLIMRAGWGIERRQMEPGNRSITVGVCSKGMEVIRYFNESRI